MSLPLQIRDRGSSGARIPLAAPGAVRAFHVSRCPTCGAARANAPVDTFETRALKALAADLEGAHESCWRFFETLFVSSLKCSSVKVLAKELGVGPSTLISRFFRVGLPSPTKYLAYARLTRAAALFEDRATTIYRVAYAMEASSPQAFNRTIRTLTGVPASEFRAQYDADAVLRRFREELVLPYLEQLLHIAPLLSGESRLSRGTFRRMRRSHV